MRLVWLVLAGAACRSAPTPALEQAGDDRDDGAGLLARASVQLELGSDAPSGLTEMRRHHWVTDDGAFGGTSYAGWMPPAWSFTPAPRPPRYAVTASGLDGSIDGVVTWAGALPPRAACGTGVHVSAARAVSGALVYIAHVATGRAFPAYAHVAQIGGTLVKRGCALGPDAQIVAPVPATLAIHGDAQATHVRVTSTGAPPATLELQAGGVAEVALDAGVVKIDSADGALGPAWVIGVETPYSAITDDTGRFRIDELPPGAYDVTIFAAPIAVGRPPIVVHRVVRVGANVATLPVTLGR